MPVPVMAGMTPLEDCVISFSQCAGAEKDSLTFLANRLGARYVVFFVHSLSWCIFLCFDLLVNIRIGIGPGVFIIFMGRV